MAKGSGRRRITPADGLQYNPDTDMTNIEERGGTHFQSGKTEIRLGLRTGAVPTRDNFNCRYAGKGRKDDNKNWKSQTKGKQFEKNLDSHQTDEFKKPIPEGVARRMREKSINADIAGGRPCKTQGSRYYRLTPENIERDRQWVKRHK